MSCPSHEALTRDITWLIKIGYGVFMIGLAVIVLGITTIFYAGGLSSQLEATVSHMAKMDDRLTQVERTQWMQHPSSK